MNPIKPNINLAKCSACGGRCCQLYLSFREGGAFPEGLISLQTHKERWRKKFLESGAWTSEEKPPEARYDPLTTPDAPDCEFRDPKTGCLLPNERRTRLCLEFMCED